MKRAKTDPFPTSTPRGSSLDGNEAQHAAGLFEGDVEQAVGAGGDVADAADALEDDLLVGDLVLVVDDDAAQFLSRQRGDEEVVFPSRETVARVEIDAADGERGCPVNDRRLHAFAGGFGGDGRAVVIHAVGDDRPAVVAAGLDAIELVAAARAVLGGPKIA